MFLLSSHVEVFIPKEIIRRGNSEVYLRALRKGSTKNTHCNLIVLGQARVGKTSLIKSILGEDFDKDCKPTQGVRIASIGTELTEHIHIRASEPSEDEEQPWAYTSVSQHASDQISHTIVKELRGEVASEAVMGTGSVEQLPLADSLNRINEIVKAVTTRVHEEKLKASSEGTPHTPNPSLPEHAQLLQVLESFMKQQGDVVLPPSIFPMRRSRRAVARVARTRSGGPQQPSIRVNVGAEVTAPPTVEPSAVSLATTPKARVQSQISYHEGRKTVKLLKKSSQKLDPTFHTIDFAGQEHYRPMHHCFITHRALYIVAFKLPEIVKCIEQQSDCEAKTVPPELQYWLNNIYAHASSAVHGENADPPKIFLVGTHKFPSFVSSDEKDVAESDLELLDEHLKNTLLRGADDRFLNSVVFTDDRKCFYALENSMTPKDTGKRNESGIISIQKSLKKTVSELKFLTIDVPISWMKFEKKLMDMRSKLSKTPLSTTREDVWPWAKECGMDDKQFQAAMQYYHDIRIIIDQGMCLCFV